MFDTTVASRLRPENQPAATEALVLTKKFKQRGKITKWLAITWLVFLVFTAIGANKLPYVYHSCSQFAKKADCSTHVKGGSKLERPPVWATFADTTKKITKGTPARAGLFGTDTNGFDIFSRAMFGARNSLLIGFLSIVFGLLIGGILGLASGYFGGKTDRIIDTIMNIFLAFPALLLAIFIVGFFSDSSTSKAGNRSIGPIILALVLLSIPPLTRLVRANTVVYAQREFVTAARSIGASNWRIITKEILPNVVPTMLTFALTGMAVLIVAEGALASPR